MSTEKLDAYIASLPVRLEPTINMEKPNAPISIYKGLISIIHGEKSIECTIDIAFTWFPRRGVEFTIEDHRPELYHLFYRYMDDPSLIKFQITGLEFGQLLCRNILDENGKYFITGLIKPPVVQYKLSRRCYNAEKVEFHLFNFSDIIGNLVRKIDSRGISSARLVFPMENFEILVDSVLNSFTHLAQTANYGGYGLTHVGRLISKANKTIDQAVADNILQHFSLFSSFLAGRRIYTFFKTRKEADENIWTEYSNYSQDPYSYAPSWLPQQFDEKIGYIWEKFYRLCQDDYNRESLYLVIHWYLSANKGSGGLEGSIILLQNAFELLFRWIAVEQNKMVSDEGGDTLRASDKIRMLLYLINRGTDLPIQYQEQFRNLIKLDRSLIDFPYLFTEIRNSYVHSNRKKRKKISRLPTAYLDTILTCGLYYVELLILYLLEYEGKVAQRIPSNKWRGGNEAFVPWVKSNIIE